MHSNHTYYKLDISTNAKQLSTESCVQVCILIAHWSQNSPLLRSLLLQQNAIPVWLQLVILNSFLQQSLSLLMFLPTFPFTFNKLCRFCLPVTPLSLAPQKHFNLLLLSCLLFLPFPLLQKITTQFSYSHYLFCYFLDFFQIILISQQIT